MSRTIALHETFGAHPDALFAAAMRKVKEGPGTNLPRGAKWLESERALRLTYDVIAGHGHPVANETAARIMSGVRNIVGAASLRNLPITIIPSDAVMNFMAAHHLGMSGFNVLGHLTDGTMTRAIARHLEISSHSYMDYAANSYRRYENQINWSGLASKVPRAVVKATGADLWTRNGRLGWQVSMMHQMAEFGSQKFDALPANFRDNFLKAYGFTPEDWDKIRAADPFVASNGAKYLDPTKIDKPLSDRLLMAVKEQGSYAFHQPDARTEGILRQGAVRGSLMGEFWLSTGQYKQFALERMTTHLMRILVDGPIEDRIGRGLAFVTLSALAGATSLQAAAVLRGENPLDMKDPKFWTEAFAKGGAGGVYGDLLAQALRGGRSGTDIAASLAGPVPGLAGDFANIATAPAKALLEQPNKQTKPNEMFNVARRWTPNTWYSKLVVDRMLWDKLQVLLDPNYRQSFSRSEQAAKKNSGGYWWGRGESTPGTPDLSTALGH
jgi:DNA-directed RNA polymerase subunit H (RpoH/RPB5)